MSYNRLKKHRAVVKQKENEEFMEDNIDIREDVEMENNELIIPCYKSEVCDEFIELQDFDLTDEEIGSFCDSSCSEECISDDVIPEDPDNDFSSLLNGHLQQKIKNWVLRNVSTLTQKSIDEILMVIRSEGYTSLPKCSKTLLGTSGLTSDTQIMKSSDDTLGKFKYFGIKPNLESIIYPDMYNENEINLIIHVDGMDIYNKSKKGFWSIMGKVFSLNYRTKPFLIGLYFGNSKPYSAGEFMTEFIMESNVLTNEGIKVNGKDYRFKILAFCCDMPARAFIKCTKSHTGFFSCERCQVKGETINSTRVFTDINCEERTMDSFRQKNNPEHHLAKEKSPLLKLVNFDVVKFVILDEMHMLYLGIGKFLLQKFILRKSVSFVLEQNVTILQNNFFNISKDITAEFQRKSFDLINIGNWKATQFRFFLLYGGGIILKNVLSYDQYRHFLLLYTACRILSSSKLATLKPDYAKKILRIFVEIMPHYYGPNSQTMNIHNLIHIADDVVNMGAPLSQYSAFDFENSLGYIKSIVKSPTNPIAQIQRKLHVFHSDNSPNNIPLIYPLNAISNYSLGKVQESSESRVVFSFVNIHGFKITSKHPDNVCLLENGNVMVVKEIFNKKLSKHKSYDIFLKGNIFIENYDFFDYPLPSREIGLHNVGELEENYVEININIVEFKCILTKFYNKTIAITLLHK